MEHRTILFVDQVGSTRKLADLGDEAMVPIRQRLWTIVRGAVDGNNGRVFSDEGDGGAAVFEEPGDAHAASLAIVRSASAADIELRVGLHTGSVVTNGDGFVGLAVHMAARLCDAAPAGFVLTTNGEDEHDRESTMRFTPFGRRSFKGFPEPVDVALITDLADDAPTLDDDASTEIAMLSSPLLFDAEGVFVGRDDDVERLVHLGSDVRPGGARVALISGEAGAGKSTLAHRVGRSFVADGALCLVGRGDDSFDDPFHEIIEPLAHLVRQAPVDLLADHVLRHGDLLTRWLPGLGDRVPSAARGHDRADLTPDRLRLYEAVVSLLRSASNVQPVVLLLEDLHRSAPPTLDLVRYLLDDHDLASLTVMVTYRSTEVDDGSPLAKLLARQARNERAENVRLGPLDRADIVGMIEAAHPKIMVSGPDLVQPLADHVVDAASGNALFCAQIIRHLDIEELLAGDPRLIASSLAVPASVKELACDRVDWLGADVAELLATASVFGERFRYRELQQIPGNTSDATLLDTLERAERAQLVRPIDVAGIEFGFGHALVRDALYERMTTSERMRRHRAAANAVRSESSGSGRASEELAHLTAAGPLADPAEVWSAASLAANDAAERLALHEAIGYRQRAVDALAETGQVSPRDQAMAVFELGRSQTAVGMAVGGITMIEAAGVARRAGDWDLFAEIAVAYGGDLKENQATVDVSGPVLLIEEALEHHTDSTTMRALLLISLALWQRQTMTLPDRRRLADEAVGIVEAAGDDRDTADVLAQRHRALHGPEVALEALTDADRLDVLARRLDDESVAFQAMNLRVMATFQLGDWPAAQRHVADRNEIGEHLRNFEGRRLELMWNHLEENIRGDFAQADTTIRQLNRLIGLYPNDVKNRFIGAAMTPRQWLQGHAALMYEMMPRAVNPHLTLSWLAAESGQLPAARHHLERSGGVARMQSQSDYMWSHDVLSLTRTARALGDSALASELSEAVLPFRECNAVMGALGFLGAIEHHLGTMATTMGEFDAAIEHYELALDRHEAMSATPFSALTWAEMATVLRRRGADGDDQRAVESAANAQRVADELGLGLVHSELER